jgi:hypothetical protein
MEEARRIARRLPSPEELRRLSRLAAQNEAVFRQLLKAEEERRAASVRLSRSATPVRRLREVPAAEPKELATPMLPERLATLRSLLRHPIVAGLIVTLVVVLAGLLFGSR